MPIYCDLFEKVSKLIRIYTYRTCAIISRGLYIFYPIFEDSFILFKEVFSEKKYQTEFRLFFFPLGQLWKLNRSEIDLPDEFKRMEEFRRHIREEIRANTYDNFPVCDYQLDVRNLYYSLDFSISMKHFLLSKKEFVEDAKCTKDYCYINIVLLRPRNVLCNGCNKVVSKHNWIKHFDHEKE